MRLLLFSAALFLCSVSAWALSLSSFFGNNAPQKPYLHPLSPPERDPTSARTKRQAYQVYVDGDVSVTVDKSGQKETGNWGPWIPENECSRSCGGGVQLEKRQCSGDCTGASVRYISCGLEPCEPGFDFRSEQCAKFNDEFLDGNYYKWTPYKGKNKCELVCKPESGNFYYKWADKVVDGTKCDSKSNDICVDGECLPVGCDGKLGSSLQFDKCGKCDGDGSTCKTIEGRFDERNLSPGYHDIIKLPEGATNIKIQEARKSTNTLALKNGSDHFYLNGNGLIQVEKEVEVGGTIFVYDDAAPETLSAQGPLSEELTVAILFRKGNRDTAIKYEFSTPLEEEVAYKYIFDDWTQCSVTCGKGVQTRNLFCVDGKTKDRVEDGLCEENNSTKPEFEKSCETVDCEAEWFTGDWESCSSTCGDQGQQYRVVYCHQVFANGRRSTVNDGNCTVDRPSVKQTCNRFACPEWHAGPWSACSEKCGDAYQYRSVTCRSEKQGEEAKLLPADACPADEKEKFEAERTCNLGPCEGLTFQTGEWELCTRCNDTEETREVTCKDTQGRAYPLEKCLIDNSTEIPIAVRSCATQPPCVYEWTVSEWSKCTTECGHGHKTRRVVCAIHQNGGLEVVAESHCQAEKPEAQTNCTNEEKCTGTWYASTWSECTVECGGGTQERAAVCLNYDKKPVPEWCDEAIKPAEQQECNVDACPTCADSDFGCCPDNVTIATGEFNFGCSNCSETEFGCCADNVTIATGPNSKGCEEFVESPLNLEADVAAIEAESSGDAPESLCSVTNENGEAASVECATIAPITALLEAEGELFGNETDAFNETIHCSKTEFGCCPDWYSAATGKNNEGCPSFILGGCNETKFGCCHDEVTLARGSNLEGCGEPSCAASLYGCCKDRKTIAFGPHYSGCDRSSFPCEISNYGCCPDGETAALGKNGTGCGENCLITKFGCCPDGKTTAKGTHNEGCGCEFAQYGCCPDGKSVAKGAGFYGCPESCAQSQFGCCPDGKTRARGENKEGCPCQYTRYGCCPDGETTALGPRNDGCDNCRYAKHGCCPDGETKALGPEGAGCPATTTPPFLMGGTVAPHKIAACNQSQESGTVCGAGYKLSWHYDTAEGRCNQFWYGGCGGNDNNFVTQEMCETICVEPPGKGRCYLPRVDGPLRCEQLQPRYYYDHTKKHCVAFWWRGCLGNANNFNSFEECSMFCKDVGPFEEPTTTAPPPPPQQQRPQQQQQQQQQQNIQYAPTPEAQQIDIVSAEQPQQPQQPQQQAPPQQPRQSMEDICKSRQDAGPCETYSDQWFYNAFSKQCETFTYGGCGGNLNRFRTKDECEQRCFFVHGGQPSRQAEQQAQPAQPAAPANNIVSPPQEQQPSSPVIIRSATNSKAREACHLNVDQGRCKGAFDSWYYEVATGSCVSFKYTGCGGNANRFASKDQCESLCVKPASDAVAGSDGAAGANSVCDEAKDTGPCTNFATKWYYNKADGTCNRFHYGGCQGTNNRFNNEQQCKAACQNHQDVCTLPKVQGPCSGKHTYYFFNLATQQCETFVYGGCLGNSNRFATVEECNSRCPKKPANNDQDGSSASSGSHSKRNDESELPSLSLLTEDPEPRPATSLKSSFAHSRRRDAPLASSVSARHHHAHSEADRVDCYAVPDPGSCANYRLLWHYSASSNSCRQFYYGGCAGNTNRFESRKKCETSCVAKIEERVESVSEASKTLEDVRITDPRMDSHFGYHDPETDQIEQEAEYVIVDTGALPELCMLPEQRGSCYDHILRWRYDSEKSKCVSFMYSGCNPNANHFTSEESCERACGKWRNVAVCELPADHGDCQLAVPRWYHDPKTSQCKMMMWTGCGGNGNSFSSKADCESLCRVETSWSNMTDFCTLKRSAGPCTDSISMWYFDSDDLDCKPFTYGGCRGNQNRFVSKEQCQQSCRTDGTKTDADEVCALRPEPGPCRLGLEKYFYDPVAQTCHMFHYGGCEGNPNRFDSELECFRRCSSVKAEAGEKREEERIGQLTSATTPVIYIVDKTPLFVGNTFRIRCNSYGALPVTWYKNGGLLQFGTRITEENDDTLEIVDALTSDAGVYTCIAGQDSQMSEGVEVVIKRVHGERTSPRPMLTPSKNFSFGTPPTPSPSTAKPPTSTTTAVRIYTPGNSKGSVSEAFAYRSTSKACVDTGNASTCGLIVKNGLCEKKRYGTFCCHTCTKVHSFKF